MTLVEVLMTLAVLAVLLALGFPGLHTWLLNARIRTASEEMLAGVQLARTEAVRRNCNAEFRLDPDAGWTVRNAAACICNPSQETCPFPPDGSIVQTHPPLAAVNGLILTPTPGGATRVTFDALGHRTDNIDGSDSLTSLALDLDPAVLSAAESRNLMLDISLNGQIRLCDPTVTLASDSRYCS